MTRVKLFERGHRFWQRLPAGPRRELLFTLTTLLAPRASLDLLPETGATTVAGLFSVSSGLGQGARRLLSGLRNAGFKASATDLGMAFGQADMDWSEPAPSPDARGPLLVHINGPYVPYALLRTGHRLSRGRYVIGYWNWELPVLPGAWRIAERHLHEIWVPSRFVAEAVTRRLKLPVHVVPYWIEPQHVNAVARERLGIRAGDFVVFTAFNAGSGYTRKNPEAAIAAFRKAFGDAPDTVLIVKIANPSLAPEEVAAFQRTVAGMKNLRLLTETVEPGEMAGLIALSDVVISLHRAEGLGFLPAEAMLLGKPVIATGWSGNIDFMSEDNSRLVSYRLVPAMDPRGTYDVPGAQWADPDVEDAAEALAALYAEPDARARLGLAAQQSARQFFCLDRFRAALSPAFVRQAETNG